MSSKENAQQLNDRMVDLLVQAGRIRTPMVEQAFRRILRHELLPTEIAPSEIYEDKTIIIKTATDNAALPPGRTLSSSTMPGLLAPIIEASCLTPGLRVLQIGTGSGYLASLIAHIVTDAGVVMTVEIDPDVAENTTARMSGLPLHNVHCVCADGYFGYPQGGPYDRIVATASCADVPLPWIAQLNDGGKLVLPFSLSQNASGYPMIRFAKTAHGLVGKVASDLIGVGFVPLYGPNVAYPVLYQDNIGKLEAAAFSHIQSPGREQSEYFAIGLVLLLGIAKLVEKGLGQLGNADPTDLAAKARKQWETLGKPKVGDFEFHLVAPEQTIDNQSWRFPKRDHVLYVTTQSHIG